MMNSRLVQRFALQNGIDALSHCSVYCTRMLKCSTTECLPCAAVLVASLNRDNFPTCQMIDAVPPMALMLLVERAVQVDSSAVADLPSYFRDSDSSSCVKGEAAADALAVLYDVLVDSYLKLAVIVRMALERLRKVCNALHLLSIDG